MPARSLRGDLPRRVVAGACKGARDLARHAGKLGRFEHFSLSWSGQSDVDLGYYMRGPGRQNEDPIGQKDRLGHLDV